MAELSQVENGACFRRVSSVFIFSRTNRPLGTDVLKKETKMRVKWLLEKRHYMEMSQSKIYNFLLKSMLFYLEKKKPRRNTFAIFTR